MSLKERLRGVVAAVATAALAISVAPVTALAAQGTWTGTEDCELVLRDVADDPDFSNDLVSIYKIADIQLQGDNTTKLVKVDADTDGSLFEVVKQYIDSAEGHDTAPDSAAQTVASEVMKRVEAGTIAKTEPTSMTMQDNDLSIMLPVGVYYVKIANTDTFAYQDMVVRLAPGHAYDGTWSTSTFSLVPKRTDKTVTKTIESITDADGNNVGSTTSAEVGDTVHFKVSFSIGSHLTDFTLSDTMSDGLTFVPDSVKLFNDKDTDRTDQGYIQIDTENTDGATFVMRLTDSGRQWMTGSSWYITYDATVNDKAAIAGATNSVTTSVDGKDESELEFGQVTIFKYEDSNNTGVHLHKYDNGESKLQGATFTLYEDESATTPVKDADGNPITLTTGKGGLVNSKDSGVLLQVGKTYYLKETSAPATYEINPTVYSFTATEQGQQIDVWNVKAGTDAGMGLPTTGGPGTIALTVAGAGLVAGAAYLVMRSRKEN